MLTEKEIKQVAEKLSANISKGSLCLTVDNVAQWAVRFEGLDKSQIDIFRGFFEIERLVATGVHSNKR